VRSRTFQQLSCRANSGCRRIEEHRIGKRIGKSLMGLLAAWLLWLPSASAIEPAATDISPDVSAANWYWGPANRWSWHNARRIFPTAEISRGNVPVTTLAHANHVLSKISFMDPVTHKSMTVAQMLDATYTDGFLVLQHGQILAETYRNGMTPDQPHMLMSISKSVMGTLAGVLVGRGALDSGKQVTDYVPEMKGTVYEGATVRNLLDMSVDDPQERAALKSSRGTAKEYEAVDEAGGWLPATANSAPGLRAYLTGLRRPRGQNGKEFLYLDQSAILIGWVMERATGRDLCELLREELWAKLGAEQSAYMLLDHHQQAYSSAGFNATLRDLGRFGDMMAHGGRYNGQQIVPESWVDDIRFNGAANKGDVGLAASAPWPGHRRGNYRSFWWLSDSTCGRFAGVGLGGQLLIIDPIADMVVVKFDSVPDAKLDEKTYQTEYQAIDAIIQAASGHGCS
jgi:CubicO group peptidase (beta-lactamase class C family)